MKQYFITAPFSTGDKLILSGDNLYGETIGIFVFLYDAKTRKKIGHIKKDKLLSCSVEDNKKIIMDVPFGIGHVRFENMSIEQTALISMLVDNQTLPVRRTNMAQRYVNDLVGIKSKNK